MSNLGPLGAGRVPAVPTLPRGESIGRYDSYLDAQRAVDFLSDEKFPVQFVTIVGTGLRMVERVTGRLTYPRVAFAGAASGAWFGTFVGLLLLLFSQAGEGFPLLAAILLGAGFGMLFGLISYTFTRGRRDFTSTSQIVASEYEVLCAAEHAQAAREVLWRLPGGRGLMSGTEPGQPSAGPWPPPSGPPHGTTGGTTGGRSSGRPAGPAQPYGTATASRTEAADQRPETAAPAEPDLSGPTYGEVMARRRREEAERRAEAERREREDRERQHPSDGGA